MTDATSFSFTPVQTLSSLVALTGAVFLVGCGDSGTESAETPAQADPQAGYSMPMNQPAVPAAPPMPPEVQAIVQKGQSLAQELQAVETQLAEVQQKALASESVSALREALEAAAEAEILKDTPEAKASLERFAELVKILGENEEIAAGDASAFSEATQALIQEYETLGQEIQPLQAKVAQLPSIEKARNELFEAVKEEATKLDPNFAEKEAQFESLQQQLGELEQEFAAAQQKAMEAMQGASASIGAPAAPTTPDNIAQPIQQAADQATEAAGQAAEQVVDQAKEQATSALEGLATGLAPATGNSDK